MGFKLIKHLESSNYNRKLFYLDFGEADLPPIRDKNDIQPGSEARSLETGDKWILNTEYKWIKVLDGALMHDVPDTPIGAKYVREATAAGGAWTEAQFTADVAVNDFTPNKDYLKHEMILFETRLYRAKGDFTSGSAFNPVNWEAIEQQIVTLANDFAPFYQYKYHEMITKDGKLFRATAEFTSTGTFNSSNWEEIIDDNVLKGFTLAQWQALFVKPDYCVITDSIFDI